MLATAAAALLRCAYRVRFQDVRQPNSGIGRVLPCAFCIADPHPEAVGNVMGCRGGR